MASSSLGPAVGSFSLIVSLWILCTFHTIWMHSHWYNRSRKKIKPILRNVAIIYLCSWSTAYILVLALTTLALSDVRFFYNYRFGYKMMMIIIMVFSIIGFMAFYVFTTFRLYYTFHDSIFEIKVQTMTFYIISAFILSVSFCFIGSTYFLFKQKMLQHPTQKHILLAVGGILAIINMFMALSLVYLFSSKLMKLVLSQRTEQHTIIDDNKFDQMEEPLINQRQKVLIKVVTKQVLLNVISIISFNVLIPLIVIIYAFLPMHTVYIYLFCILLGFICHSIEMIGIILSFSYNQPGYDICCKICHKGCNQCCNRIVERAIIRRMSEDNVDHPGPMSYQLL